MKTYTYHFFLVLRKQWVNVAILNQQRVEFRKILSLGSFKAVKES